MDRSWMVTAQQSRGGPTQRKGNARKMRLPLFIRQESRQIKWRMEKSKKKKKLKRTYTKRNHRFDLQPNKNKYKINKLNQSEFQRLRRWYSMFCGKAEEKKREVEVLVFSRSLWQCVCLEVWFIEIYDNRRTQTRARTRQGQRMEKANGTEREKAEKRREQKSAHAEKDEHWMRQINTTN